MRLAICFMFSIMLVMLVSIGYLYYLVNEQQYQHQFLKNGVDGMAEHLLQAERDILVNREAIIK